jgi:hypothetical protein
MEKLNFENKTRGEKSLVDSVRSEIVYKMHTKKTTLLQQTSDESEIKKALQCVNVFNSIKAKHTGGPR